MSVVSEVGDKVVSIRENFEVATKVSPLTAAWVLVVSFFALLHRALFKSGSLTGEAILSGIIGGLYYHCMSVGGIDPNHFVVMQTVLFVLAFSIGNEELFGKAFRLSFWMIPVFSGIEFAFWPFAQALTGWNYQGVMFLVALTATLIATVYRSKVSATATVAMPVKQPAQPVKAEPSIRDLKNQYLKPNEVIDRVLRLVSDWSQHDYQSLNTLNGRRTVLTSLVKEADDLIVKQGGKPVYATAIIRTFEKDRKWNKTWAQLVAIIHSDIQELKSALKTAEEKKVEVPEKKAEPVVTAMGLKKQIVGHKNWKKNQTDVWAKLGKVTSMDELKEALVILDKATMELSYDQLFEEKQPEVPVKQQTTEPVPDKKADESEEAVDVNKMTETELVTYIMGANGEIEGFGEKNTNTMNRAVNKIAGLTGDARLDVLKRLATASKGWSKDKWYPFQKSLDSWFDSENPKKNAS